MVKFLLTILFSFSIIIFSKAQHSSFNSDFLRNVVLIEKKVKNDFKPHGTAFVFLNYDSENSYVVTNKHVIGNYKTLYVTVPIHEAPKKAKVLTNLNDKSEIWDITNNNIRTRINIIKDSTVVFNDKYDIAVFKVRFPQNIITTAKDTIQLTKVLHIPKTFVGSKDNIEVGTDVFFVGFPFFIGTDEGFRYKGLYNDFVNNPLVRKGIIAWKSKNTEEFLIDGYSFGGNSGSPVFTSCNSKGKCKFVGIVFGHLNEIDKTIKNKDDYIKYNAGLARCVWANEIVKTINKFKKNKASD